MKTFQKVVLPAALSLAGLVSQQAMAANTTAGLQINNTASMTYDVNSVAQDAVTSTTASFVVDARVNVNVDINNTTALSTGTPVNITTGVAGDYYLVGIYEVTNTGNVKTVYNLAVTNVDGTVILGETDNKDAASVAGFRYFDGATLATELTGTVTVDKPSVIPADATEGVTKEIYVYAPTSQITGVDGDAYGFKLTATASQLIEVIADGTADAAAKAISAYTDSGLDNVELEIVADTDNADDIIALAFPKFDPDADPATSGFTKTATVVWDPINLAVSPIAIPGATVKYTITLTNRGSSLADNVVVTDGAPANTVFCNAADNEGCEDLDATGTFTADADATDGLTDGITYSKQALEATDANFTVSYDQFAAAATSDITFTVKLQ